ncbi:MAG: hypothetical protein QNJ70_28755 [Xenococcaceae cyanobacterium MO_207.B15]|nr:hypothetical protein [Xenococcaceae cyanobacterium MO_207.B15]MDJ0745218.1 hypothetical protein [Xenococcaceae cyanobacterium MO_167.B27]
MNCSIGEKSQVQAQKIFASITKKVELVGALKMATYHGTSGNDTLSGGSEHDRLYGYGGNDKNLLKFRFKVT